MPGGDRVLLEELARLEEPARPAPHAGAEPEASESRPRAREARAPGFAVLVDPDEQDAMNLVALRSSFEPAIAFATEGTSRRVLDLLEEADWRIVRIRRPADIGAAWAAVGLAKRGRTTPGGVPARASVPISTWSGGDPCILIPSRSPGRSDSR